MTYYSVGRPTAYSGGPPEAAPETWRTGLYWLHLVDPPPELPGVRGGGIWAQCRRCGVLARVTLPADLGDAVTRLREICAVHERCAQTLIGARWELLVTLRRRLPLRPPGSGWLAALGAVL